MNDLFTVTQLQTGTASHPALPFQSSPLLLSRSSPSEQPSASSACIQPPSPPARRDPSPAHTAMLQPMHLQALLPRGRCYWSTHHLKRPPPRWRPHLISAIRCRPLHKKIPSPSTAPPPLSVPDSAGVPEHVRQPWAVSSSKPGPHRTSFSVVISSQGALVTAG